MTPFNQEINALTGFHMRASEKLTEEAVKDRRECLENHELCVF